VFRSIDARIEHDGFVCEERFACYADADAWEEMMSTTLSLVEIEKASTASEDMSTESSRSAFDLLVYAKGLADSIRTYGGERVREEWLFSQASPEDWAQGKPVVPNVEELVNMIRQSKRP
jgi:hypothetical protein